MSKIKNKHDVTKKSIIDTSDRTCNSTYRNLSEKYSEHECQKIIRPNENITKLSSKNSQQKTNIVEHVKSDEIIAKAKKLPYTSFDDVRENMTDKVLITKFMFDQINNYDTLVENHLGKKYTKSYKKVSMFGKPTKNLNFVVEKAFEHILCPLFKSKFLDYDSVQKLCGVHPLYYHYYISTVLLIIIKKI